MDDAELKRKTKTETISQETAKRSVKSADFGEINFWISLPRGQREETGAAIWRHYIDYIALLL